jgi:DNA polymerase III sliding clamp (beta) subunit (PCNA family)
MATIRIPAPQLYQALGNVAPHASKDDTLPVLCMLRLTVKAGGACVLEATDRYTLGEASFAATADSEAGVIFIPVKAVPAIMKLCKGFPGAEAVLTLGPAQDTLTIQVVDSTTVGAVQSFTFPDTTRLWPEPSAKISGGEAIGMNPANLCKFAKMYGPDFRPLKNVHLSYTPYALKPAPVTVHDLDNFRAIVMPVRLPSAS